MESSQKNEQTPRRSQRLVSVRDSTPKIESAKKVRGPRSMSKLKKATREAAKTIPTINIIRPSLPAAKKEEEELTEEDPALNGAVDSNDNQARSSSKGRSRRGRSKSAAPEHEQLSKTSSLENSSGAEGNVTVIEMEKPAIAHDEANESFDEVFERAKAKESSKIVEQTDIVSSSSETRQHMPEATDKVVTIVADIPESTPSEVPGKLSCAAASEEWNQVVKASEETTEKVAPIVADIHESTPLEVPGKLSAATASEGWNQVVKASEEANGNLNDTPQLMDESIISVNESPSESPLTSKPINSTFSPIVDASIHDSRPTIDVPESVPVLLRTSTPHVKRVVEHVSTESGTPKSARTLNKRVNTPAPSVTANKEKLNQTLNKSILKSTRKRSMSVADAESFMQKRVMFNSPKYMPIDDIDEKMIASFIEEKENAFMHKPQPTSARRKRSFSTGTPSKPGHGTNPPTRSKMPNFQAIHEMQFKKMESIDDHAERKLKRAKQLGLPASTEKPKPPQSSNIVVEEQPKKATHVSRIPTRFVSSSRGASVRTLKRSMSASAEEPLSKKPLVFLANGDVPRKVAIVSGNPRPNNDAGPSVAFQFSGQQSTSQKATEKGRSKVEERREKNAKLFKSKLPQRADRRAQSVDFLKGVRLNRRFELQMQHRRDFDKTE